MNECLKGYCILWEKHMQEEQQITNFNYLNNIKVCDYVTIKKIRDGKVVSSKIYEDLFLSLNMKYKEEKELDEWLWGKVKELRVAYEYFDSNQQDKIYQQINDKLQDKEYPYKIYVRIFNDAKSILNDFQMVSVREQGLLYNLLCIDNQDLKTIISLSLVWNKTRMYEDEEIIYNSAMALPFINDYLGLYTKARMSLYFNKYDDFMKNVEECNKFIKEDNIFAQMKYYAFMEGYYDTKGNVKEARKYLDKYRELNDLYRNRMGESFYTSNCYYLWVSYYMINEFDIAYEYMEQNFKYIKETRVIEKVIYFSLCSIKGIKPTLFNPFEIDVKECKGLNKQRVQYFQMKFRNQPNSRKREYLNCRYKPLLSDDKGLDFKIIEEELKMMNKHIN